MGRERDVLDAAGDALGAVPLDLREQRELGAQQGGVADVADARLGEGGLASMIQDVLATMRRAIQLHVPIVLGTDSMHGLIAFEAAQAAALGMSNADVVRALTGRAAAALNKTQEIGALRPGLAADLIGLDADPLADVSALERVAFVMARGRVARSPGAVTPRG